MFQEGGGRFPSGFVPCSRKVFASMVRKKSPRGLDAASGGLTGDGAGPPLSASVSSTVWYTTSKTAFSWANFTWVLAGWTFTSTRFTGSSTASTQPGNFPFMSWFR